MSCRPLDLVLKELNSFPWIETQKSAHLPENININMKNQSNVTYKDKTNRKMPEMEINVNLIASSSLKKMFLEIHS